MILMEIMTIVGKDQAGIDAPLDALKFVFDLCTQVWKETVAIRANNNPFGFCALQKKPGTVERFATTGRA